MHPPGTDPPRRAALERIPTRAKILSALVLILFTAMLPRRPHLLYVVPSVVLLMLWPFCRMPFWYAVRRLLVAELFVFGIAVLSLIHPATTPLFLSALLKSNLCVLTLLLLTWTTPFENVLQEFRRWHFPTVMLSTLALMYRYLPVLGEETRRMSRARASRAFTSGRRFAWQNSALIIGRLFVRTTDRAERIYLAMCARGWK
ncbi:MAG TPA: CbiQ family ECF transporter T component [Verrucomicrobiae bacterium]|nr:CbiQ family ECF transporter T component [Verrucomicrobiae bacterium]